MPESPAIDALLDVGLQIADALDVSATKMGMRWATSDNEQPRRQADSRKL